ncbi:dienelactone hydrolase family protein [Micromonospora sp. M12]
MLTPHLFYRAGRAPLFDLSRLGEADQRAALFEKIMPLVGVLTPDVIARDSAAFLDFLAARDDVRPGSVAITGYCMGGTNALRAIEAHRTASPRSPASTAGASSPTRRTARTWASTRSPASCISGTPTPTSR